MLNHLFARFLDFPRFDCRLWAASAHSRGMYGGAVIAICLSAAQQTVSDNFIVHSYHCYFLLAGKSELPTLLHVEEVRDGRSFATHTVQARQKQRCLYHHLVCARGYIFAGRIASIAGVFLQLDPLARATPCLA